MNSFDGFGVELNCLTVYFRDIFVLLSEIFAKLFDFEKSLKEMIFQEKKIFLKMFEYILGILKQEHF